MLSTVRCSGAAATSAAQSNVALSPLVAESRRACSGRAQVVASAISKEKKSQVVANLTELLSQSNFVYGMEYKGISVPDLESMRASLPTDSSMVVTKNRLLRVAVDNLETEEERERWAGLCGQKGQNAFVFAPEESIRDSVKAYNTLLKSLKDKQPDPKKGEEPPPPPTSIKCIVMDGQAIDATKWKTLEKIPTKQELLTKIAVGIKANPRKIAVGIKALPTKLAYGVKALSELNDEKEMTVEAAATLKAESGEA
eukprot:jgi/Ulvmu1/1246/UM109_0044.1